MSSKEYSGIVLSQNQTPTAAFAVGDNAWRYQDFILPSDFERGHDGDERRFPDLTGFQLLVTAATESIVLDWTFDLKLFGFPWQTLESGSATQTYVDGKHWLNIFFDRPLPIIETIASERFRIRFRTSTGITNVWYSTPNPLALLGNAKAYTDAGVPITVSSNEFSLAFRILGATADEGTDFLGNRYRSVVVDNGSDNVATTSGALDEKIFLSAPQPSRFAVVSQYFDQSIEGQPQTVDSVLLDPTTPGMYFHVYYSNEGDPPTTLEAWENKLWIGVPRTYHAVKRDTYALPEPITAKYIKIEYSHLQAKPYTPGNFEQPIQYKKYPKWVLNYFLARTEAARAEATGFVADRVGVVYNALDLAYNYYLDDIRQSPDQPVTTPDPDLQDLQRFLATRTDTSDQVDAATMAKINLSLQPYRNQPALLAKPDDYLLAAQSSALAQQDVDYPTERDVSTAPDIVALKNTSVVFEQTMPVMFFYLTCRHHYREVAATFDNNRAYFAGVREIVFNREHYTIAADSDLYIEAGADFINTERNDFVSSDRGLVVE